VRATSVATSAPPAGHADPPRNRCDNPTRSEDRSKYLELTPQMLNPRQMSVARRGPRLVGAMTLAVALQTSIPTWAWGRLGRHVIAKLAAWHMTDKESKDALHPSARHRSDRRLEELAQVFSVAVGGFTATS
jgi:hypothetical protein